MPSERRENTRFSFHCYSDPQSTPPHGGRPGAAQATAQARGFNPRPRTGGDYGDRGSPVRLRCFNPRPRTGGDRHPSCERRQGRGFNPRPRTGGDPIATDYYCRHGCRRFNPRPRTGGDDRRGAIRGAYCRDCFNPRPRTGGDDLRNMTHSTARSTFQSTPPHGGRQPRSRSANASPWFQSTPPHGGRRYGLPPGTCGPGVSIHAPARGATGHLQMATSRIERFNPRPRTGGDQTPIQQLNLSPVSIHAPARGATRKRIEPTPDFQIVSIHAPARGATLRGR